MVPAQLMEQLCSLKERKAELESQNAELHDENADLRAQLEWFKCNLVGTGKSEKIDALQTRLGLGEEPIPEAPEPQKETITYERRKRSKRDLPAERFANLPVKETVEILPDEVRANPDLYERIGIAEETFEVRITPASLWKRKIVRPKFRHKLDRSLPPLLAPASPRVIEDRMRRVEAAPASGSCSSMKTKQYRTIIGVDLGDTKHHVCITDKDWNYHLQKDDPQ